MLVDTHCHLFKEYYDNFDLIIKNAKDLGVYKYISAACDDETMDEMIELAHKFENIYICVGIHPENVNNDTKHLEELLINKDSKIVAIGEIGLDYYYGKESKELQIDLFCKQLELAQKYDLPIVVHSREATLDTIECLKKYKVRGVIHCFSGSLDTAKIYIKMGFYIGVGGVMTFKNSKIKEVIKEIPLDKILLETDSPYLAPVPFRGTANEPKNIKYIAEFLSELKEIPFENVVNQTTKNAEDIFDF